MIRFVSLWVPPGRSLAIGILLGLAVRQTSAANQVEICPPSGRVLKLENLSQSEKVRRFQLEYSGKATQLAPGTLARVWVPLPPTTEYQLSSVVKYSLPSEPTTAREAKYGNCILHFATPVPDDGELRFSVTFEITRAEVKGLKRTAESLSEDERRLYLAPDRRVPTGGKPLDLLRGLSLPNQPLDLGRSLYERVDDHMRYDKSRPGYGRGDSVWACDSRFGNCTDFHSLFISMARGNGLPSRFEIGFPLPEQHGRGTVPGYHCWAFFHTREHGWVPVDISEADKRPELKDYYFGNLTADRVAFSIGRDLTLEPKQAGDPLNFFVYPYIEIDRVPLASEKLTTEFRYTDLDVK